MRVLSTVLFGCLAVSAAGAVWLSRPEPVAVVLDLPDSGLGIVIAEPAVHRPQPVTVPQPEPVLYSAEHAHDPQPQPVQRPVQPIEERGDAMIFEMEALALMPFDEAIVMPFD